MLLVWLISSQALMEEWTTKGSAVQDINSKGSALCSFISVLTSPAKTKMSHKSGTVCFQKFWLSQSSLLEIFFKQMVVFRNEKTMKREIPVICCNTFCYAVLYRTWPWSQCNHSDHTMIFFMYSNPIEYSLLLTFVLNSYILWMFLFCDQLLLTVVAPETMPT